MFSASSDESSSRTIMYSYIILHHLFEDYHLKMMANLYIEYLFCLFFHSVEKCATLLLESQDEV